MRMIDALYPEGIPAGVTCDAIAAYIDHSANPHSFDQAVARFPHAVHLKITVTGDPAADAIDGESGTGMTPADCVAWARKKRLAGQPRINYCNESLTDGWGWAAYRQAYAAAGEPEPLWWVANYDDTAVLRPGEWARQYWDLDRNQHNTYDTSITATPWPPNGDDMSAADVAAINAHTDAAIKKVLDQAAAVYADPAHPYSNRNILLAVQNPTALAAAIVAKLPASGLTQAQIEAALRAVFADAANGPAS